MSRFKRVLTDLDSRLVVPEPARSRVLLEVAADMDDLYREYLARGRSEEEAEEAVVDHFDLSEEVLHELIRVHDTPLQRSLETLSGQVRGAWARAILGFLAALVAVGSGSLLFRGQLYRDASEVVYLILPLLAWGLWIAGHQLRGVLKGGNQGEKGRAPGLGRLPGLAALMVGAACAGLWVELYLSGLRIRANPTEALVDLVGWLHMASATLVISLSCALVLGFLWFFLASAIRHRELSALARLLNGSGS